MDLELVEYVAQLREGILEAFTGIVSGFKDSEKGARNELSFISMSYLINVSIVSALGPYVSVILDISQRAIQDSERTESTPKLVFGLIGDLASAFPNGQIKQLLLSEWIASELRGKRYSGSTKVVQRWAREVS